MGIRPWSWWLSAAVALQTMSASADTQSPYPVCTKTPTKADQEAAEGAFKAGFGSYQEGDYDKAIMYWEDAYQRDCTAHALLLNLASVHEKKAQWAQAKIALEVYLERATDVPNRAQIERRIENLKAQIAAMDSTSKPPAVAEPPPKPDGADETKEPSSEGKSIVPWIVVGAGGVISIVGVVLYAGGSSKVSDAESVCGNSRKCPNTPAGRQASIDGDDGRTQMTTGAIVTGVGLAGVAGGLVWHFFFDNPSSDSSVAPRTRLQPAIGQGYTGLSLGGSF